MTKDYIVNILNSDIVSEDLNTIILLNGVTTENVKLYKEIAILFFEKIAERLEAMDIASVFISAIEDYNSTYTAPDDFGRPISKYQRESFLKSLIYSYNINYIGRLNPEEMLEEKDFLDIDNSFFQKQ